MESSSSNWFLSFAYGEDYETALPTKYLNLAESDRPDKARINKWRLTAIGMLLINVALIAHFSGWYFIIWLTDWGAVLTLLCLILTQSASKDPRISSKTGKLAWIHILTEICLFTNLVITLVYWTVLHFLFIEYLEGLTEFHMYAVHSFPFIATLMNLHVTDI